MVLKSCWSAASSHAGKYVFVPTATAKSGCANTTHWDLGENTFSYPAYLTWFHGRFHVAHAKTVGKYIQNSSLGPCPFPAVFVQTNGSWSCFKAPPGAGEGAADMRGRCQQPLHRKRGKQIRGMGVQGTVEALWYKTVMIKINEAVITHWKCQVWVLWSCSRSDSGSPKAGLLTTIYTSNSAAA